MQFRWVVATAIALFTVGVAPGAYAASSPGPTPPPAATPLTLWSGRTLFVSGSATDAGSTDALALNAPIVDMVPTTSGKGYWLLAGDGGVFSYGDAAFYGSTGDLTLAKPVVGMSPTPTGRGYWFVASDGGVFAFGDAGFYGSVPGALAPGATLSQPIVGMVPTASGKGYWMVAADGGVFAFGDAGFVGSLGGKAVPAPVASLVPGSAGQGYWMVDRIGNTYAFGVPSVGSFSPVALFASGQQKFVAAKRIPGSDALLSVNADGSLWAAGVSDASTIIALQPATALDIGQSIAALAIAPDGKGVWVASTGNYSPRLGSTTGPYTFISTVRGQPARWPSAPITWFFNPALAPSGGLELIARTMGYLGTVTGFTFAYGGTVSTNPMSNIVPGTIVIGWGPNAPPGGWTQPRIRGTTFFAAGIELNANQAQGGFGGFPVAFGPYTWGSVLLHELGHAMGLNHVGTADELMGSGVRGNFGPGDLAGLARVSPNGAGC